MNWSPLLEASHPIPLHAFAAMAAFALGLAQFALPKGTTLHRIIGTVWVALMVVVAATSLLIFEIRLIGPFSPIHLLSLIVFVSLFQAIRVARQGRIEHHRKIMTSLFLLGLVLTGFFTFFPGRIMSQVLFGA